MGFFRGGSATGVVLFMTTVYACSSSDQAPLTPAVADAGTDVAVVDDAGDAAPTLAWKKCPGPPNRTTECTKIEMPLDWSAKDGKTISIYVHRSLAESQPAPAVLWSLPGGPGQEASLLNLQGKELAAFDLYTIDFRGSGQSTPFACSELSMISGWFEPGDVPKIAACAEKLKMQWGDGLRHFSTSNAARDLAEAMRRTEVVGQERYVIGFSFGTLLAQRLLQVAPELRMDGVILDSVVSPTRSTIQNGVSFDTTAKTVLDTCTVENAVCREKVPDTAKLMSDVAAKLPTGHCPTSRNLTPRQYRRIFGTTLASGRASAFTPLLYRYNRCAPEDEGAIHAWIDYLGPFQEVDGGSGVNVALFFHVTFSELTRKDDPSADAIAAAENASVASAHDAEGLRAASAVWPVSPPDPLDDTFPTTNVPLLMLSGGFDVRTPRAEAEEVKTHFLGEKQLLVKFAGVGHTPFPGLPCVRSIVYAFLENPKGTFDTSCANEVTTAFDNATLAKSYFGRSTFWDNP